MKPRVLVITTYYSPVLGGVETHARQLVRYLHRSGFNVQVLTKRVDRQQPRRDTLDDVTVHRVGPAGDRRARGKWVALPALFFKTMRLRSTFDVIVCIDYRGVGIAAILAARLLRRKIIAQAGTAGVLAQPRRDSGVPPESRLVRFFKWGPRLLYRGATAYVCIAHDIEREALTAGIDRRRVHYLPHGVDLSRFRPPQDGEREAIRQQLGWPLEQPVVLFVGRLSTEKGVMDLLEAWRIMRHPDALLVLVGPDMPAHPWNAGPQARAFVESHGLAERVRFEGAADDTAPFYRAADVFAQPSHFEAFGISAIEAMASGAAIVAARVGGLRDFVKPGRNGLLHEARDPMSLSSALREALDSPALRATLAAAALDTVTRLFDERVVLERYASLIEATATA
jgi:glycosyltransferase involved in cell wall biosynthesis